jgi:hypothetical protein
LGYNALSYSTGSDNTAVGHVAGQPWSGSSVGYSSTQTTAVGASASVVANQATAIGYAANASGINSTALGNGAQATLDNTIQLGNSSVTKVSTAGTVTANGTLLTSDIRLKKNIQPLTNASRLFLYKNSCSLR